MNELTVFIGRFSPFHLGHADVLSRALLRSQKVLILIGSSNIARNVKNPFTWEERASMIRNSLSIEDCGRVFFIPINDHPYNDQRWIVEVQSAVENICSVWGFTSKPTLTGANRDASTWYLKAFGGFFKTDFVSESESKVGFTLAATRVREEYFSHGRIEGQALPDSTKEFLENFKQTQSYVELVDEYRFIQKYKKSWEHAPYAPTFLTVDAVVVQSGHVLVVERDAFPGRGLWALPGGFLEQNEKILDGCIRELQEETKISLSPAQLYGSVVSKEVFDNPDRSLRGRTITVAHLLKLKDTAELPKVKPQAGEARKVLWLPLVYALANPDKWFEDHHAILSTMIERL